MGNSFGKLSIFLLIFLICAISLSLLNFITMTITRTFVNITGITTVMPFNILALILLAFFLFGGAYLYNAWQKKQEGHETNPNQPNLILHDIYDGLCQLEERIDNLEAILHADDTKKTF